MKKILSLLLLVAICGIVTAQEQYIVPKVTQTEGHGNGGQFLYLSDETVNGIMAGAPWKVQNVEYANGGSPIQVRVVDPTQLHINYDYVLKVEPLPDQSDSSLISNAAHWTLTVLDGEANVVDTYQSQHTIGEEIAEAIPGQGISIAIKNHSYSFYRDAVKELAGYPDITYQNNVKYAEPDLLGSFITYSGAHHWLSGIADDDVAMKNNWIRAGHYIVGPWDESSDIQDGVEDEYYRWRLEDYFYLYRPLQGTWNARAFRDYYGQYENVLGGTWAPYPLASAYDGGPQAKYITPDEPEAQNEPQPAYYDLTHFGSVQNTPGYNPTMTNLYSVDIVLTPDQSKWTRAVVLEAGSATAEENFQVAQHFNGETYYNIRHEPKKCPSVGKNGQPDNSGTTGMGWFPGYAINVETGERLNIMFAENSADTNNNGADMLFNPTSDAEHWGGCHFVYVCGSTGSTCSLPYRIASRTRNFNDNGTVVQGHGGTFTGEDNEQYAYYDCGAYDEGKWLKEKFATFTADTNYDDSNRKKRKMQLFNNVMWTSIPMPAQGEENNWLSCDATIRIRVARPFMFYSSAVGTGPETPENDNAPAYRFNMRDLRPADEFVYHRFGMDDDTLNIINVNEIDALISPIGVHFFEGISGAGEFCHYYVPKSSKKGTYFSQSLWFGGLDENEQLHLAAMRFGQIGYDFWTGPLSTIDATIDAETVNQWNRCFKITRNEVMDFLDHEDDESYAIPQHILDWPAHGDTTKGQAYNLAPYVDVNGDNHYDPQNGDYPSFPGDMCLFFIFNDNFAAHGETGGTPVGMEVHGMVYAFNTQDDSLLNHTLFFNYKMYNRSQNSLHNTYIGLWSDWDLGYSWDDYVACDVQKSTAYCYNGTEIDGGRWEYTGDEFGNVIDSTLVLNETGYGENPPIQTLTVLGGPYLPADSVDNPAYTDSLDCALFVNNGLNQYAINGRNFGNGIADDERLGLTGFTYHCNDNSMCGDPISANEYYAYLNSTWKDGTHVKYGGNGHPFNGACDIDCRFMFPKNSDPCYWGTNGVVPDSAFLYGDNGWDELAAGNAPSDKRGLSIVGPFDFEAGGMQEIDFCLSTIFPSFMDSRDGSALIDQVDQLLSQYEAGDINRLFEEAHTTVINETICEGEEFEFHNEVYQKEGIYTHKIMNESQTQIIEVEELHLTVIPTYEMIYAAVEPGQGYHENGFEISAASTNNVGIQIHQLETENIEGCPSTTVLFLDVRLNAGIENYTTVNPLSLYPNPTTGLVQFTIDDADLLNRHEMVQVYDLSGRMIQCFNLTELTSYIDLTNCAPGLYIVKAGNYMGKIVKK